MPKWLLGPLAAAVLVALGCGTAGAGLEPNAQGKLQWYNDATCVVHGGVYYPATEPQGFDAPTLLVSATGLSAFRGADVQIIVQGLGPGGYNRAPLPASWQVQTGGCAQPRLTITKGSGFANCYPSAWASVAFLATAQEGMYFNYSTCITPNGVGVFWLQAAGAAGSDPPLDPSIEYGLYSISVAQTNTATSTCSGNSAHGATPVAFYPWYRIPCADVSRGEVFAALDADDNIDYAPFPANPMLSYNSPIYGCILNCGKTKTTTWGQIRRAYH